MRTFVIDVPDATSPSDVLSSIHDVLSDHGVVRHTWLSAALEREDRYPTGLPVPGGAALPHAESEHVLKDAFVVARPSTPIAWGLMGSDGGTVDASIIVAMALTGHEHISVLRALMTTLAEPRLLRTLREGSAHEIQAIFSGDDFARSSRLSSP